MKTSCRRPQRSAAAGGRFCDGASARAARTCQVQGVSGLHRNLTALRSARQHSTAPTPPPPRGRGGAWARDEERTPAPPTVCAGRQRALIFRFEGSRWGIHILSPRTHAPHGASQRLARCDVQGAPRRAYLPDASPRECAQQRPRLQLPRRCGVAVGRRPVRSVRERGHRGRVDAARGEVRAGELRLHRGAQQASQAAAAASGRPRGCRRRGRQGEQQQAGDPAERQRRAAAHRPCARGATAVTGQTVAFSGVLTAEHTAPRAACPRKQAPAQRDVWGHQGLGKWRHGWRGPQPAPPPARARRPRASGPCSRGAWRARRRGPSGAPTARGVLKGPQHPTRRAREVRRSAARALGTRRAPCSNQPTRLGVGGGYWRLVEELRRVLCTMPWLIPSCHTGGQRSADFVGSGRSCCLPTLLSG